MKDLVEYIVKNIVSKPEAVTVEEQNNEGEVTLLLSVDPVDMGVVIGRSGQMIKAIRKILTVRAIADQVKVNLSLVEPGVEPAKPEEENSTPAKAE